MRKMLTILTMYIIWIFLTWDFNWQYLVVGAAVSILIGLLFGNLFISDWKKVLQIQRAFWCLVYIPVFLWEMAKANFDVAYRVIHPKRPIDPGIVKVKTALKSEMAKVILANSITLTPGTFTIDIVENILYIHCIKVRHTDIDHATEDIVERFESILKRIFD